MNLKYEDYEVIKHMLEWYQEIGQSMKIYLDTENKKAFMALLTELELDAGKRAEIALRALNK